jgi:hypothetical protein
MQSAALGGLDIVKYDGKPDRKSLLFSAVLLIAWIVVYEVAQQFHAYVE